MDSFRELTELRGNQGREEEEEGVISVEPITIIVSPALQDLSKTLTPESSASSSARDNGGTTKLHRPAARPLRRHPATRKGRGMWLAMTQICPWAVLHHEVVDSAPSISGYKKLEDMVRAYHIPRMILLRAGAKNERACTVSRTGWIPVLRGGSDAADAQQHKVHHRLYAVVCEVGGASEGDSVQVAVPVLAVSQLQRRKVVLPLQERKEPAVQEHLEALVTSKQLAVFGFVDMANLFTKGSQGRATGDTSQRQTRFDERPPPAPQSRSSSHSGSSLASKPCAEQRVETVAPSARRRACEETDSEDEVLLMRRRTSGGTQPAQAAQPAAARSSNTPSATARVAAEPASASASVSASRIAYPDGFSYVKPDCHPPMVQGMQSFVPPVDRQRARTFVQQHGGQVAMVKLMDNNELSANCKQLATKKTSLVNDVNHLQGLEMANRAAAAESQADELANRNNELREELERACAEKGSGIQVVKDETARVEERAKKAEAERERALNELSSLKHQVAEAARNLNAAEEALNELKISHRRSVSIARAQGAEWLVGSAAFQDAVMVASANMTTEIYNEIRGKVLHHRPDFPICELAFFDGEDIDEQGKSLAPLADTTVWLRWDLNEEGVPVWPPSVLEEGEDPTGLPSFDGWVEGAPVAE
ncbi:hypothetical protein SLEP1_g55989 [Rubroshorea leprosula]|uniref:Uncharacterized protein n=1 Tax=Rubroshorea leprosula TaxID=152421 RepID=A0AAV5MLB9_9ROSI|nr:hypothetical protein SLEP1_g55989 [Rubroshorea leprosula]